MNPVIKKQNSTNFQEREAILAKKFVTRWRNYTQQQLELRGERLFDSPSFEILKKKVFAVHATQIFPKKGKIIAGGMIFHSKTNEIVNKIPFRNTLHFALGGLVPSHSSGNWEEYPYAVITLLSDLVDRIVNLFPYDTFILGNLKLSQNAIIVAEEGKSVENLDGIEIVRFDPKKETLRSTIDKVIKERNGWLIKMYKNIGTFLTQADSNLFPGRNLCSEKFWRKFLTKKNQTSFGPSGYSYRGKACRLIELDNIISDLESRYLNFSNHGDFGKVLLKNYTLKDFIFIKYLLEKNSKDLKHYLSQFPKGEKTIEIMEREINVWKYVIDLEILYSNEYRYKFNSKGKIPSRPDFIFMSTNYGEKVEGIIQERVKQLRNGSSHFTVENLKKDADQITKIVENPRYSSSYSFSSKIDNLHNLSAHLIHFTSVELKTFQEKVYFSSTDREIIKFFYYLIKNLGDHTEENHQKFQEYIDQLKSNKKGYRDFRLLFKSEMQSNSWSFGLVKQNAITRILASLEKELKVIDQKFIPPSIEKTKQILKKINQDILEL